MADSYKPADCNAVVTVENLDIGSIDIPDPLIEKWTCACLVEGGVNTGHVSVLTLINPATEAIENVLYYTQVDGELVELDAALIPLVGDCLVEDVAAVRELVFVDRCDDINGDGSDIVRFVDASLIAIDHAGIASANFLGSFTDQTLGTAYVAVAPGDCCDIVDGAKVVGSEPHRSDIDGPNFSYQPTPSTYLESLTVIVKVGSVQVTDANGTVSIMSTGESNTWVGQANNILSPIPVFSVPAGARACFLWTEPLLQ